MEGLGYFEQIALTAGLVTAVAVGFFVFISQEGKKAHQRNLARIKELGLQGPKKVVTNPHPAVKKKEADKRAQEVEKKQARKGKKGAKKEEEPVEMQEEEKTEDEPPVPVVAVSQNQKTVNPKSPSLPAASTSSHSSSSPSSSSSSSNSHHPSPVSSYQCSSSSASTSSDKGKGKARMLVEEALPTQEEVMTEIAWKLLGLEAQQLYELIELANMRLGARVMGRGAGERDELHLGDQRRRSGERQAEAEWKEVKRNKHETAEYLLARNKKLEEEKQELMKQTSFYKSSYETARASKEKAERELKGIDGVYQGKIERLNSEIQAQKEQLKHSKKSDLESKYQAALRELNFLKKQVKALEERPLQTTKQNTESGQLGTPVEA